MDDDGPGARRELRAGRSRGLRRALGVLVVLAVLAGGATVAAAPVDGALRGAAQDRVAQQVVRETGATGDVEVTIGGGWFVPQALRGSYPRVRVQAAGVPVRQPSGPAGQSGPAGSAGSAGSELRLEQLDADLVGVTAPLRGVLGGAPQVRADSVRARVLVAYPVLNGYLAGLDRPLRVAPEPGEDRLRVTTGAQVLGREVELSGWAVLEVTDGDGGPELRAVPDGLDLGGGLLDRLSRSVLRGLGDRLAFTVPLGELPLDLQVTGVEVRSTGVAVTATGTGTRVVG